MRFLITNDDGIEAPGLRALVEAARELGSLQVVAPLVPMSTCGHAVTTHTALHLQKRETGSYALDGTPADCVRIALHNIDPEPDWVFSGINAGGNLGVDVFHSGTVAAAREAALQGRKA